MVKLAKIILWTSMSTADAEINVFPMNIIKSQLRSRIGYNRVNALGLFSMEKTIQ